MVRSMRKRVWVVADFVIEENRRSVEGDEILFLFLFMIMFMCVSVVFFVFVGSDCFLSPMGDHGKQIVREVKYCVRLKTICWVVEVFQVHEKVAVAFFWMMQSFCSKLQLTIYFIYFSTFGLNTCTRVIK